MSEDWRYRYSASGEREQKRLYAKTSAPSKEWTYYLLDGAKRQLAVYKGIETLQTSCSTSVEPQVYFKASEYLSYGVGSVHSLTTKLKSSTSVVKEYSIQDHLGSTRMVVMRDDLKNVSIMSRFDYEPFGGILWQSGLAQRQGFIDKETDKESGLGDFGVRKYDDGNGRFTSIDPLWEKYRSLSPYNYAKNNPLVLKDSSGRGPGISGAFDIQPADIATGGMIGAGGAGGAGAGLGQIVSKLIGFVADVIMFNAVSEKVGESYEKGKEQQSKVKDAGVPETTEKIKERKEEGRDGAKSRHLIETDKEGKKVSTTHQVEKDGEIIHQHQNHISQTPATGQRATVRRFPDEWVNYPEVNKPSTTPVAPEVSRPSAEP